MGATQQVLASYGASFSPLDIAKLSEWFSIESLAAVGDGNPISSWVGEKSLWTLGASGTARPTYEADDGDGQPAATFDAVDDKLVSTALVNTSLVFGSTGDCESWAVVRSTGDRGFFGTGGGAGMGSYLFGAAVYLDSPGAAERIAAASGINDGSWHVLRLAKTGARRIIQADGVTIYDASTVAGTWTLGNLVMVLGDTGSLLFLGAVRHLLTFTDLLTADEVSDMQTYLEGFI